MVSGIAQTRVRVMGWKVFKCWAGKRSGADWEAKMLSVAASLDCDFH